MILDVNGVVIQGAWGSGEERWSLAVQFNMPAVTIVLKCVQVMLKSA